MLRVCPSAPKQELEFPRPPHKGRMAYMQRPTEGTYELPRNPSGNGTHSKDCNTPLTKFFPAACRIEKISSTVILLFALNSYLLHLPFGSTVREFFRASVIHIQQSVFLSVIAGSRGGKSPQETSEKCKSRHLEKNKTVIKNGEDTFEFNLHPEERGGIQPGMGKQFRAVRLPQKVSALAEYWSAGNPFQHELYQLTKRISYSIHFPSREPKANPRISLQSLLFYSLSVWTTAPRCASAVLGPRKTSLVTEAPAMPSGQTCLGEQPRVCLR